MTLSVGWGRGRFAGQNFVWDVVRRLASRGQSIMIAAHRRWVVCCYHDGLTFLRGEREQPEADERQGYLPGESKGSCRSSTLETPEQSILETLA